jgi:hypothetical protein
MQKSAIALPLFIFIELAGAVAACADPAGAAADDAHRFAHRNRYWLSHCSLLPIS